MRKIFILSLIGLLFATTACTKVSIRPDVNCPEPDCANMVVGGQDKDILQNLNIATDCVIKYQAVVKCYKASLQK